MLTLSKNGSGMFLMLFILEFTVCLWTALSSNGPDYVGLWKSCPAPMSALAIESIVGVWSSASVGKYKG